MGDQEAALAACDSAHKDHVAKAAGVFIDGYFLAEGQPDADALRQACGERFKTSLRVYKAAHDAMCALAREAFPSSAGAAS
jgi:hypothetical protein